MRLDERERLIALLAVPSISSDPDRAPEMSHAAELCADEVRRAGGTAEVVPGQQHPMVLGHVPASRESAGTVLLYGHYDVQPPGEASQWLTPPFTPTVRDGRLVARGTCDDKGCLFMLLVAVQRLAADGRLGVDVRFLIDGEEESGGSLTAIEWLMNDPSVGDARAAVVFDGPMIGPRRPAFWVGVRGIVYARVTVRAARADGHSGLYGGAALNAAHALVRVLDAVLPREGRLHDELAAGATPPQASEREAWEGLPDGLSVLTDAGLAPSDSTASDEFYERTTASAALDVHGIAVGDPDRPATVIPAVAAATLSLRLAPGQDAERGREVLVRLLRDAAPPGARIEVEVLGTDGPSLVDPDHPVLMRAADFVEAATGARPAPVRSGGSLPIIGAFAARGLPVIMSGFYLPGDGIHSPNEGIDLDNLELGTDAAIAILESFASG